ncbi:MAG: Dabb family protein [Ruminococcaceae bacterium]|nr:Dabb family protein [Oscillospiraceae bacterium]
MVKHMIIWKIKEDCDNKKAVKENVKRELEALNGKIAGLVEMHIITDGLPSSSGDLMMDSLFENAESLKAYQKHPLHQHTANTFVRPNMCQRLSLDYEI